MMVTLVGLLSRFDSLIGQHTVDVGSRQLLLFAALNFEGVEKEGLVEKRGWRVQAVSDTCICILHFVI